MEYVPVKATNAGMAATYVNTIIPKVNTTAEASIVTNIPFLYSKDPSVIPSNPVVKSKIIASWGLTIIRSNAEENNTIKPRKIFITAAIAIGSVLNGLKASPIAGKKIGADWNITAIDVNKPPILIN